MFLTDETTTETIVAEPRVTARRGAALAGPLDFSYQLAPGEAGLLALRHPSGALTFHLPVESNYRGTRTGTEVRFVVMVRSVDADTGRRGIVSSAIKAIVIKVAKRLGDKLLGWALPKLATAFESAAWRKKGLDEGWYRVTRDRLATRRLTAATPSATARSLLFLHGTFSEAATAFAALASSSFFERVASLYEDRIFAFNHFTVSRTPEENARMLLEALPNKTFTFDVISHSRGGLVLRNLVERASVLGRAASRFQLRHAVLVASPNDGTPLATPARWQDTVGWFANLLELFPENPFTTGAEFVANAIVWLARHASGDLPGLHAMDADGDPIAKLQGQPGPPSGAYSALVSNYHPTGDVLRRMIDTGIDQFFGSANDLVVPSEGGWRIDHSGTLFIPGSRIGCFGAGGNMAPAPVTHGEFFSHPETVDFLVAALSGQAQPLAPLDPARALPDHRLLRGAGYAPALPAAAAHRTTFAVPLASASAAHVTLDGTEVVASDNFHLLILPRSEQDKRRSQILAHYGSARVLEDFHLGKHSNGNTGTDAGKRWQKIIAKNESIKKYIDGDEGRMLSSKELQEFGEILFETLLPGDVRRLYDTARSLQRGKRLNVILTSTIDWVADKPWEFAYDPVRKTSLATEDLHFIRNVMTAVPAEIIDDRARLRILVASSQPMGTSELSIEDEEALIRRGFEGLSDAGLVDIEVLARATPQSLHGHVQTGRFSIVHFIGHGEYDAATEKGYLIFEDAQGNPYRIDDRSAKEILCGRAIRLVFLNACDTGRGSSANFNSGIAPALMAGGVPIVVANQYKVLDKSATFFAQHFYWALAQGQSVGEAAREARVAVNYSSSGGESIDWAVPVVYARDPNSRLAPRRPIDHRTAPSPAVRPSSRRSVSRHKVRVAVWDTNSQFPNLRGTLERMNLAQSFYGFEVVDLSVPIDAFQKEGKVRYLDADRFAERLAPQIAQLGVHYISAIVNERMGCYFKSKSPHLELYGWWSDPDKPPVLIFSTYGLDLAPKGPDTDRAIANVTVSGLASHLTDEESHSRGPRDCPQYFNPNRLVEVLAGPQKFCKKCSKTLPKEHPAEFEAMKAILTVFGHPAGVATSNGAGRPVSASKGDMSGKRAVGRRAQATAET